MLKLNNLSSPKGAHRNIKRIGRGQASGQGTQAGKGHKGQKARSGGGVRPGFESGAMPLYIMVPKRGFKNPFKKKFATVSLTFLAEKLAEESVIITQELLIEMGVLKGKKKSYPVKVLFEQEISSALKFEGDFFFSASAKSAVENAGGSIVSSQK